MNNAQKEQLVATLERGAASLRETGLPGELAAQLERLAGQVDLPCVLAVVGRMKAGKSTFVNAAGRGRRQGRNDGNHRYDQSLSLRQPCRSRTPRALPLAWRPR